MSAIDPDDEPGLPERRGGCPDDEVPLGVVIPDDLRDLDADIAAYHRERRQAARRARLRQLRFIRTWDGRSRPGVVVVLLGFAMVASLATLLTPQLDPPPQAAPLADTAVDAPGGEGALVPDTYVTLRGLPRQVRDLRPAVLALPPPGCDCAADLDEVSSATTSYQLPLYLVGEHAHLRELTTLASRVGNGTTQVLIDEKRALLLAYAPTELTLVLVHADGLVGAVVRWADGVRLDSDLAVLTRPGAR